MTYFQNEKKAPWKHESDCKCSDCNPYFFWNFELKALFYYTTNFCVKVYMNGLLA